MSRRPTARAHRSLAWLLLLGWLAACAAIEESSPYGDATDGQLDSTSDGDTSTMGGASSTETVTSDLVTVTLGSSATATSDSEASSTSSSTTSAADTSTGGGASTSDDSSTVSSATTSSEATTESSSGGATSTMASATMGSNTMATNTMAAVTMAAVNTASTTTGGMTGSCGTIHDFDTWNASDSFTYGGDGSSLTATQNAGAGTLSITGTSNNYAGIGLVLDSCIDAPGCTGIAFDVSGSLGGGAAVLQLRSESNLATSDGGTCTASDCSNNAADYTVSSTTQTVRIPWASFTGGSPVSPATSSGVCGFQWQFHCTDGGACAVNVTLDNLRFY